MSFMVLLPARTREFEPPDDHGAIVAGKPRVVYNVYGGKDPTLFKTLRNAVKKASMYDAWEGSWETGKAIQKPRCVPGLVVKFDPGYLPIVLDPATSAAPTLGDVVPMVVPPANNYEVRWEPVGPKDIDEEYALAERQMLMWQERVLMLKAKLRTTE